MPKPVVILNETAKENHMSGFIRIYRNISSKCWYTKSEYVHLWVHLIIRAARKEKDVMVNGTMLKLMPGQILTSRDSLEKETGIDSSKVQRLLKFFTEIEHQIEQQTYSKYRVITIKNWHLYQSSEKSEQQSEQQVNSNRTASEQQLNTYNKLDNIDKGDNIDISTTLVGEEPRPVDGSKDRCQGYVDKFNAIKKSKYTVTPEVKKKFKAAIVKYTPDQIVSVLESALKDPKHIENNCLYVTPEFVLRPIIIERYLNQPTIPTTTATIRKIDHSHLA